MDPDVNDPLSVRFLRTGPDAPIAESATSFISETSDEP